MVDYTRMTEELLPHNHSGLVDDADTQARLSLNAITRQITPGPNFNTLVGTTDDMNANIITIEIPEVIEGHQIAECGHKVIKWINLVSKEQGATELQKLEADTYGWVVPMEAMTKAGSLKISISIFDVDDDGNYIYRWNSLPYSGLTIGQGMDEVDANIFPPNEIIDIDLRSRAITIPSTMNREVGKQGETPLTTLRFRYDRYYQNTDFGPEASTVISIIWSRDGGATKHTEVIGVGKTIAITANAVGTPSDLVQFDWSIPQTILNSEGPIEFSVCLANESKMWYSETCSYFAVGTALNSNAAAPVTPGSSEMLVVDGEALEDKLTTILGTPGGIPAKAMTLSEAIAYAIERMLTAGITIEGGNASDYI